MMTFTEKYFDLGGSVYFYSEVDKLPRTKENALLHHLSMDCRSWTFARLTQEEKESYIDFLLWANNSGVIKGTFDARWEIMSAIYSAFLIGTGYHDPLHWREKEEDEAA